MRAWMTVAMAATVAFGVIGCGGPYSVDLQLRSVPADAEVLVTDDSIQLQEGVAVAVVARPIEDGELMDRDTPVMLEPANPTIFGASRGEWDDDADRYGDWHYILYGRRAGATVLDVWIDGELEGEISAFVSEQN